MAKILLIEDEAPLRAEVAEWLFFEGYDVVQAEDGIKGVEATFTHLPDLILCDIMMPRLDGYGVLLEVNSNPATVTTPLILLTAKASHEDMRTGMTSGADDYIIKPFTRHELLTAVQKQLDKRLSREQWHAQEVQQLQNALNQEHEQRIVKAKLVGMFSHDFRNPLSTILSSNSLLRDYADRLDAQRRLTHLNRIDASVRQLIQMLDDMLIVTQMEAGSLEFKPEPMNIDNVLRSMVEEFQAINSEVCTLSYESQVNETVLADVRLIRQIASNLISNAVKYSPLGGQVQVSLESDQNQCVITVQDHGIGIEPEDQERLFSAFQRGSNVGRITGTGLGLAIVKEAVSMHKGSIQLESQVGKGTTVKVCISVQPAETDEVLT
ncbi:MAG: response regulator [Anaerolineaceae bacterium]|nr:response regulator [Anaerolineaceae bacterium]